MLGEQGLGILSRRGPKSHRETSARTLHATPLTLNVQTRVVSDEDTAERWEAAKKEAIEKVSGIRVGQQGETHL